MVVVADDEVYPQRLSVGYLVDSLDATIHHDNQRRTYLVGIVHTSIGYAVALVVSPWDIVAQQVLAAARRAEVLID